MNAAKIKRNAKTSGQRSDGRHNRFGAILLFFLILMGATLSLFLPMATAQEPKIVRVGAYDNPPKISVDAQGNVSGFWVDLMAYIAAQEGWQIEYVPGTWVDGLDNLQSGAIDIMPDVAFTDQRAARYAFSDAPVLVSWSRLYVRDDNTDIRSINDLDNKKVAALRGGVNLEGLGGLRELVQGFDLNVTIVELDNYQSVFQAIENGEVDAGITNRNFGDKFAENYAVKATSIIFQPIDMKFAFPKTSDETPYLVERINARMAALKQDNNSVYYQLLAQYFETGIAEKKVVPRWLVLAMQFGLATLIIFGLAIVVARSQIKQQTREIRTQNEALRTSEERYRAIFNSPSDAIFIHDAKTGKILDVNAATFKMYGYTRDEMLQLDIDDMSPGGIYTQEEAGKRIRRAVEIGEYRFDWQVKSKTGREFWVDVILKHTIINRKSYVIAVIRDIDRRKQAESALAAEKERLAVTLNSIGDGVIATDNDGKIVMLNKIAAKLTGWKRQDAIGKPLLDVFTIVDARTGTLRQNPVERVLSSGKIVGLANHTVLVAKDGARRSIADSGAPIFNAESQVIGVILVFRDVTEKEKNEAAIMKIKKLESVGVLAGGIAHDFNNILTAILGNISLARLKLSPKDEIYALLTTAEKASMRAKDLTRQLLTFSKGGDPVKKTTSIAKVIADSANFILHGSSVACRVNIPDDLWLVDVDPGQISQVIQNIILNAREAMPAGGVITINGVNIDHIRPEKPNLPDKKYIKIIIKDTGSGIPQAYLDKIFDPYFSTKQQGSGLGLAITHTIIHKHEGDIDVQSTMGRGTTFSIFLPVSERQTEAISAKTHHAPQLLRAKVLVMDDEKMVQDVIRQMLESFGNEVLLTDNGEDAIRIYREHWENNQPIDAVIMDLTTPGGMGGKDAVQGILQINPAAKVIVASGYSNDPVLANYEQYGFSGAMVKPFQVRELSEILRIVLS